MVSIDYVAITIGGHYVQAAVVPPGPNWRAKLSADGVGVGPNTVFKRLELPPTHAGSKVVAFMMHNGRILEAFPAGDRGGIFASATSVTDAARFEETWLPDDRIALRTSFNTFVTAEDGGLGAGSHPMWTDRDAVGEWEKFYYEVVPTGLLPVEFQPPPPGPGFQFGGHLVGGPQLGKHDDKQPIKLPPPAEEVKAADVDVGHVRPRNP